ncbi:hypothetical protein [Mycobacteroides franklinii]|jgi:phenylpyruvate tautomerase PptA (4-oxalocrotonate tautomerase family)|uniref:hypothetical protein n=1 Tax=Mycobacteroides franklinii TaxID=948102 RepID=UPI0013E8C757
MVFVRVHTVKGSITAEQKRHLSVQLIAAVAKVEGLVDNDTHRLTSWVQIFELDPENWFLGSDDGDSVNKWQVDVITPQKLLQTPIDARRMVTTVTAAVRSVVGEDALPARGPWVQVYVIPYGQWSMDGKIPDWDDFRARLAAESPEAEEALDLVFGPDRTVG